MSLREFFAAIPKVDLNLQLTGAFVDEGLLMIARQNGVPAETDDYAYWADLLVNPDDQRIDELAAVAASWVRYPEDIARVVYDIGVGLAKAKVSYAEIAVTPSEFMQHSSMSIDVFINALNDGRDRALRGWGADMSWILCIPRDNPRVGDDVARWATGATAKSGNVVALGLIGEDNAQPLGQFKRAFATARKKGIYTVAQIGGMGADDLLSALEELEPHRLTETWGIHDKPDILDSLAESGMPIVVSISRALRRGLVDDPSAYPLRALVENDVSVLLASGMPRLYRSSLVDEYVMAVEQCGLDLSDVVDLARRSIQLSFLEDERKKTLLDKFDKQLEFARLSHLDN
ncbi:MAG: hypothetical protein OXI40_10555 [Chloroflexota bacterium]|nr:hypothetical protein [Chloroflexota bacterium]